MDRDKSTNFKKFSEGYTFKSLLLLVLVLLLIPLSMIRGLVNERGRTAASAESDIMEAWGKELIEAGPIVIIPGIRTEEVRTSTETGGTCYLTVSIAPAASTQAFPGLKTRRRPSTSA